MAMYIVPGPPPRRLKLESYPLLNRRYPLLRREPPLSHSHRNEVLLHRPDHRHPGPAQPSPSQPSPAQPSPAQPSLSGVSRGQREHKGSLRDIWKHSFAPAPPQKI